MKDEFLQKFILHNLSFRSRHFDNRRFFHITAQFSTTIDVLQIKIVIAFVVFFLI